MSKANKNDKSQNKVDVDKIDMDRMKDGTTEAPGLLPYAHTRGGITVRPEDEGKMKGRSVSAMYKQVDVQMAQLYDQMETLAKQAKSLQSRAEISERIYEAQISFEPIISQVYHLYERKDGTNCLSLVAPQEWGRASTLTFVATVKLLPDHTWEVLAKREDPEE